LLGFAATLNFICEQSVRNGKPMSFVRHVGILPNGERVRSWPPVNSQR
jgi:hypothetical protein